MWFLDVDADEYNSWCLTLEADSCHCGNSILSGDAELPDEMIDFYKTWQILT